MAVWTTAIMYNIHSYINNMHLTNQLCFDNVFSEIATIRPDEANTFLVNTHPKSSPATRMQP